MEQLDFENKQLGSASHNISHQNDQSSSENEGSINPTEFTALAVGLASMASAADLVDHHEHSTDRNHQQIEPGSKDNHSSHDESTFAEISKLVNQVNRSGPAGSYTPAIEESIQHHLPGEDDSIHHHSGQHTHNNSTINVDSTAGNLMDMARSTLSEEQQRFTHHHQHHQNQNKSSSQHLPDLGDDVVSTTAYLASQSETKLGTGPSPTNNSHIYTVSQGSVHNEVPNVASQSIPEIAADPDHILTNTLDIPIASSELVSNFSSDLTNLTHQSPSEPVIKEIRCRETCQFCGHVFTHPGSLGRHLDLKRGTRLHPADQIDLIRKNVKRRGDVVEVKARRAKRARMYNSREDVRERSRLRRKRRDREEKARIKAKEAFIESIGKPTLPPHPSFAYLVLFFLPPSQWPHDPPTSQTLVLLKSTLEASFSQPEKNMTEDPSVSSMRNETDSNQNLFEEYTNKVNVAFEQWRLINKASKMTIWAREQRRIAEAALGSLSLYDLGTRDRWIEREERKLVDEEEEHDKLKGSKVKGEGEKDDELGDSNDRDEQTSDEGNDNVHGIDMDSVHHNDIEMTEVSAAVDAAEAINAKMREEAYV